MPEIEVVSWRLPRRIVAVRMRTGEALPELPIHTPFGAYGFAFNPDVAPDDVERLSDEIHAAEAHGGISIYGPAALAWEEHVTATEPNDYRPGEALDSSLMHSGWPIEVSTFLMLALDADDTDWRDLRASCRRTLETTIDERLHFAAGRGDAGDVAHAIEQGWPLDVLDHDFGYSPLHHAAVNGHAEVVRMLLDAGVDVNAHDDDRLGETALRVVVEEGSAEIAQLLLDAGANPMIVGAAGMDSLSAAEHHQPDSTLARLLRDHVDQRLR